LADYHPAHAFYIYAQNQTSVMAEQLTVLPEMERAICPSGYTGQPGELWYARVLPPPVAGSDDHVVFTTPYLLVEPGEREWLAYFDRTLPEGPPDKRIAAYERRMKWGPARDYWTEFVFEAYLNHRHDVIYLRGLPDVPESCPHSRVNS